MAAPDVFALLLYLQAIVMPTFGLRVKKNRLFWFLFVLAGFGSAVADEQLHYLASYRGLLSAFQNVRIADVRLAIQDVQPAGRRVARLTVSSQPFGFVESLYPFRLCGKSLYEQRPDGGLRTLLYGLENQSPKELSEQLLWLDWSSGLLRRYELESKVVDSTLKRAAEGLLADMPALHARLRRGVAPRLPFRGKLKLPAQAVLDRLSLFLRMRDLDWVARQQYRFDVAVDDEILHYRLVYRGREKTRVLGKEYASRRVEMTELDDKGQPGHIVTFWFSDDARRLPIKGHSAHAAGDFLLQLLDHDEKAVVDGRCASDGFSLMLRDAEAAEDWF